LNAEKRLGFIGIVVDCKDHIEEVNRILTRYGSIIRGRIGIPNHEDDSAVIGLIVEGTNDEIGALTGKLGNIPGIIVKSALSPTERKTKKEGSL
jgi:putative iron-only hydrogenase system regulator